MFVYQNLVLLNSKCENPEFFWQFASLWVFWLFKKKLIGKSNRVSYLDVNGNKMERSDENMRFCNYKNTNGQNQQTKGHK